MIYQVLKKGGTFIAEVKCSQNLFNDIEKHGGKAIMWKAGHSLIKAKMRQENALLAGEMSGHIFFNDRYYGYDDAIYAAARLLEILSKTELPLSSFLSDLPKLYNTPEIRVPCPEEKKFEIAPWASKLSSFLKAPFFFLSRTEGKAGVSIEIFDGLTESNSPRKISVTACLQET